MFARKIYTAQLHGPTRRLKVIVGSAHENRRWIRHDAVLVREILAVRLIDAWRTAKDWQATKVSCKGGSSIHV